MSHDKILHVPKEVVKALTEAAEMTDTVNPVVAGFAKRAEAALALQKGISLAAVQKILGFNT